MTDLRTKLIRLAHQKPELRPTLLPLLRQADLVTDMGKTQQNGSIRWHVYRDSVHVTDLTFAGKRGKLVNILAVHNVDYIRNPDALSAINRWVDSLPKMAYYRARFTLQDIAKQYPEVKLSEREVKGVTVLPAHVREIEINNGEFRLTATPREFTVWADNDINGAVFGTPIGNGVKAAKAFYFFVAENYPAIEKMTFLQLREAVSKKHIPYHYWLSMD